MTQNQHAVRLTARLADLDRDLVAPAVTNDTEFREVVRALAGQAVCRLGGEASIAFDSENLVVDWSRDSTTPEDPTADIARMLTAGNYAEGILLLELLLSQSPNDAMLLLNLGMALSDRRKLDRAVALLERLTALDPDLANGFVALGVAQARGQKLTDSARSLEQAVHLDSGNAYARRNLGAVLHRLGHHGEARVQLQKATDLSPSDQAAWLGLAQVEEALDDIKAADHAYLQTIKQGEHTQLADMARDARSRIAQRNFRPTPAAAPRIDAVMYCLGALERFSGMPRAEVQKITFEIAMLGTRGLDVNDSTQKYTVQSMPGRYSGLHLVCIEYVGFKQLDPSVDIGFDLSNEYQMAMGMHGANTKAA